MAELIDVSPGDLRPGDLVQDGEHEAVVLQVIGPWHGRYRVLCRYPWQDDEEYPWELDDTLARDTVRKVVKGDADVRVDR